MGGGGSKLYRCVIDLFPGDVSIYVRDKLGKYSNPARAFHDLLHYKHSSLLAMIFTHEFFLLYIPLFKEESSIKPCLMDSVCAQGL